MKIVCIAKRWQDLSEKTLDVTDFRDTSFGGLNVGSYYIVYGIRLKQGILYYLVVNESSPWSFWYPAEFFQVADPLVYNEWYHSTTIEQQELYSILGYKELLDKTHLIGLIEREPEDMAIFAKRKQEIDEYEALSSYIPKRSLSETKHVPKSQVYTDEVVDQRECPDTLKDFLEKYLNGQILVQKFTQLYSTFYEQEINYKKLTQQEESIMKAFRTVVENYAPDYINPNRVYASEDDVKAAAKQALECVQANAYLTSICGEH